MIKLAVVRETREQEQRVAVTPELTKALSQAGIEVMIESKAGEKAGFNDADYQAQGANIAYSKQQLYQNANIVCWFKRPVHDHLESQYIAPQTTLIGFLDPLKLGQHMQTYLDRQITPFSWELLPHHPDLQALNPFIEMSKLAGEVAYQEARDTVNITHKNQLTVMIIGTGNAGMAAAKCAYQDGQKLIVVGINNQHQAFIEAQLKGHYILLTNDAATDTQTLLHTQQQQIQAAIKQYQPHIMITAARPYRQKAPLLLPKVSIDLLASGTVIEDLAASIGGNTAYTQMDENIETANGILIRNRSNYPSQMPQDASQRYANCLSMLFKHIKFYEDNGRNLKQKLQADPLLNKAIWQNQVITENV
jgi:NAD(P) transhydrogenase subunit alpha